MSDTPLLPCAFCGADAALKENMRGWVVQCNNRFVEGDGQCHINARTRYGCEKDEAIAKWNQRADTSAVEGKAHSASVTVSRRELESLCWEVKVRFRNEPTYDKADLLADLEAWLRERGVEVSDGTTY